MDKKSTNIFINDNPVIVNELPITIYDYYDPEMHMFRQLPYYTFDIGRKIPIVQISYGINNGSVVLRSKKVDKILFSAYRTTGKVITFGSDSDMINYDNKIVYINISSNIMYITLVEEPIFSNEPMIYYNVVMGKDTLRNVVGQKFHQAFESSFKPRVFKDYYLMIDGYPPAYICSNKNESRCLTIGDKIDSLIKFIKSDEFESIEYKNRSYKFCDIEFIHGTIILHNNPVKQEPLDPAFCTFTDLLTGEIKVNYKTEEE